MNEANGQPHARKNVFVLSASQALAMTGMSMVMTVSALTGQMLAGLPFKQPSKYWWIINYS